MPQTPTPPKDDHRPAAGRKPADQALKDTFPRYDPVSEKDDAPGPTPGHPGPELAGPGDKADSAARRSAEKQGLDAPSSRNPTTDPRHRRRPG